MKHLPPLLALLMLTACGDDDGGTDSGPPAADAAPGEDGGPAADGGATVDAGSGVDAGAVDAGPLPTADAGPPAPGSFLEEDGYVTVEVESADATGDWASETSVDGFTGDAYYRWDIDSPRTGSGGTGVLSYQVALTTTGRYQFHLRSAAPMPTDDNDAFVRFPFNTVVTVRNNADATCPDGPARERPPEADGEGWFKLYQNRSDDVWVYTSHHHDNCAHRVFIEVDTPNTYTVEISGRSRDFKIDRFVLRQVDVDESTALDDANPESPRAP